jgi:thioredoxin-dependent peroxiredoxin
LNFLAHAIYSAVLDATLNYNAHAKFAEKEVDKLEAEEKKDAAPATQDESAGAQADPSEATATAA